MNVVTGLGNEAGSALAAHMDVERVAFTGSTETGRKIVAASGTNMQRLQMELGGRSPDIVFADANLDLAVPGAAMAADLLPLNRTSHFSKESINLEKDGHANQANTAKNRSLVFFGRPRSACL